MVAKSTQEKEQLIVGTLLTCNSVIKNLINSDKKFSNLMESINIYNFGFKQLLLEINPLFESYNFDQIAQDFNYVPLNERNNYYAYFTKVYEFVDGYSPNIVKSLNESFSFESNEFKSPDIFSYKNDLKKIIEELGKQNDIENLPKDIIKLKTTLNKPIFVHGYNISQNFGLRKELQTNFNVDDQNLVSIIFDKINKQLLFIVIDNLANTICYDLKEDLLMSFNAFNEKNNHTTLSSKKFSIESSENNYYLILLKHELDNNTLFEIYQNPKFLNLHFTDNLFLDNMRKELRGKNSTYGGVNTGINSGFSGSYSSMGSNLIK
jgi:hypothetical protein